MISIFLKKQIYNFDHTFKSNSLMYWDRIRKLIFKFNPIQFSCPSKGIIPPSTVQTLVSLCGSNWSVVWPRYSASRCYLKTKTGVSIRKGRWLHIKLCINWSVFFLNDGHKCRQTSRPVVVEIQTNCNFETHYVAVATFFIVWFAAFRHALDPLITFWGRSIS